SGTPGFAVWTAAARGVGKPPRSPATNATSTTVSLSTERPSEPDPRRARRDPNECIPDSDSETQRCGSPGAHRQSLSAGNLTGTAVSALCALHRGCESVLGALW